MPTGKNTQQRELHNMNKWTEFAMFEDGKILLVLEKNGTWSLPGGWCDVNQSVASNTVKETREEAGLQVSADKIIAVQDWRKHNKCNLPFGVIKIFVLCRKLGGALRKTSKPRKSGTLTERNCQRTLRRKR